MPKVVQRKPNSLIDKLLVEEIAKTLHQSAIDFARINKLSLEGFVHWDLVTTLNKRKYRYAAEQVINKLKGK